MNSNTLVTTVSNRAFRRAFARGIFCLLALVAAPFAGAAEEGAGVIEGYVTNSATNLPIGKVKITIRPAFQETLTDDEGYYRLAGVPAGDVQMEVSYLGFATQTAAITVSSSTAAKRDFVLSLEQSTLPKDDLIILEKFNVVSDRVMAAQAMAMNEQRHAPNIKNVIAFEELSDQGQENIGDYIRFLPGVAIVDDGENAGSLALGGFPPEMSAVQLDGGNVASTGVGEESSRTLSLLDVPMVNIDRIEVTKVPTPDMPATGLGGSVNLVTKSILGSKRPRFSYRLFMNFDSANGVNFKGGSKQPTSQISPKFKQPSFTANLTYPLTSRLAFSVGFTRTWRQRGTKDTPQETATWNLKTEDKYINMQGPEWVASSTVAPDFIGTKDIAMASAQWAQIAELTTTENFQSSVEWKMSRNDSLTYTIQYRENVTERANSRIITTFHESNRFDPRGDGSYAEKKPETSYHGRSEQGSMTMGGNTALNYEDSTKKTHMTLRYKHRGAWNIDGQAIYSVAKRTRTSLDKGYFSGVNATVRDLSIRGDGINSTESILPTLYSVTNDYGEVFNVYDGGNYNIDGVTEEDGTYKTTLYSGRLDIERHLRHNFSIKFGGAYSKEEKDDLRFMLKRTFTPGGGSLSQRAGEYDVLDEDINIAMNGNPVRWISPTKLYALYQEHPDWFPVGAQDLPKDRALGSLLLKEEISAAYVRFDLKLFENRLSLTGGVRFEKTKLDGWSMLEDKSAIYQKDENGIPIQNEIGQFLKLPGIDDDPVRAANLVYQERASHASKSYDDFYPSINANYSITENLVVRAAYARTIGRPDVKYIAGGMTIPAPDEEEEVEGLRNVRVLNVGNPGLEPWTADSFHLSLDSYHLKGGFGTIGVYKKNVTNFFAKLTVPLTYENLKLYGLPDSTIDYYINNADNQYIMRRWENVGDASVTGLELSYRQDLLFLPSWLKTMQLWVNYTHLKVSGANAEDFTGFTPDAFSCGINFIRPRYSVTFTCAHQAETKKTQVAEHELYIPKGTYDYQAAYTTYDISAEYSFTRSFAAYITWKNIFAEDKITYRRAPDTPGYAQKYQRYVVPSYIMIGIKGSF